MFGRLYTQISRRKTAATRLNLFFIVPPWEGSNPQLQLVVALIDGFEAEALIAGKGYDNQGVLDAAEARQMEAAIPPMKNRKHQRDYDRYLYTLRHLVEDGFFRLKAWRGIATRYAKNAASYLAAVQIRCILCWLNIS